VVQVPVDGGAAHVYTECARIWNPIHTDLGVALDAGLPGLILHGTATLAHAVSVGVDQLGGGDPAAVRRVRGRFGAMVPMPSTLIVRLFANGRFEVRLPDGGLAVANGHLGS
jgi:acyl dehydratase